MKINQFTLWIIIIVGLSITNLGYNQSSLLNLFENNSIHNGTVIRLIGGSTIKGELLESVDNSVFKLTLFDTDTFTVKKQYVKSSLLPKEVTLFSSGRYNYQKGLLVYLDIGVSGDHSSLDGYLGYAFGKGFEAGIGIGVHENWLDIPISNTISLISITSYPFYASGKYFLFKNNKRRPYIKALIGYGNHKTGLDVKEVKSDVIIETGIGFAFSSKKRTKFYLELLQFNSHAKGKLSPQNSNSLSDVEFDVYFNQIVFKLGILIGR